ncbi:hypothetical protein CDL15_Pgr023771 [Punica granatum]|uniref:Uncharacterized protein n=1 Tax=Punica granatum TaxID=22663 RepID=A0A218WSB2_PUNGR|nr:hypothetical protein CDL15_Pgr023771 [Punica granatum]PKI64096.1 hypothetical protein CRG98_015540 [Punica granatum]
MADESSGLAPGGRAAAEELNELARTVQAQTEPQRKEKGGVSSSDPGEDKLDTGARRRLSLEEVGRLRGEGEEVRQ